MKRLNKAIFVIVILSVLYLTATPGGRGVLNRWVFEIQKIDDTTRYATIRRVEDTSRAMIALYTVDKMTYEQYRISDNAEKREWGEQAKMRANKTATSYNEFILKNSFVWQGNIPADIYMKLVVIE